MTNESLSEIANACRFAVELLFGSSEGRQAPVRADTAERAVERVGLSAEEGQPAPGRENGGLTGKRWSLARRTLVVLVTVIRSVCGPIDSSAERAKPETNDSQSVAEPLEPAAPSHADDVAPEHAPQLFR